MMKIMRRKLSIPRRLKKVSKINNALITLIIHVGIVLNSEQFCINTYIFLDNVLSTIGSQ